jgi:peptide deformylase
MTGIGLRVVVTVVGGTPMAMFNPAVVAMAGPEHEEEEANLSLPGLRAPVARPHRVTVTWQSVNTGRQRETTFEGWHARVLLHEMEVLDGRLFIDHATTQPVGRVLDDYERARQVTASIFGEKPEAAVLSERLGLALLPPALHRLDGILTRPAVDVDHSLAPKHLRSLINDMIRVLYVHRGVGLAAPQVGLGLRIITIDSGEEAPLVLINPSIVDRDEREEAASEGCLSVPGWRGAVGRSTAVKVRTDTVNGDTVELDLSGFPARIAQHELDHLDGVLFTQRMDPGATLQVVDADAVADDLARDLQRRETEEIRDSARRAKMVKASPKRRKRQR